jgi:hypothetical protein
VSQIEQMRGGVESSLNVVDRDGIHLDAGHCALEDDHRRAAAQNRCYVLGAHRQTDAQQPVDAAGQQIVQVVHFTG